MRFSNQPILQIPTPHKEAAATLLFAGHDERSSSEAVGSLTRRAQEGGAREGAPGRVSGVSQVAWPRAILPEGCSGGATANCRHRGPITVGLLRNPGAYQVGRAQPPIADLLCPEQCAVTIVGGRGEVFALNGHGVRTRHLSPEPKEFAVGFPTGSLWPIPP